MSTRRQFLSAALIGLPCKAGRPITGTFVNESHQLGHQIRDRKAFPAPRRTEKFPIVIVGGGIAGLSAAWRLDKRGFKDFVLLEMDARAGGNSRSGQNEVSAYPWAAHYIPVPNKSAEFVRELMEELGVLREGKWDERYLCFSPQERLFIHGRWQEGLEPELAATAKDHDQYRKFDSLIQQFRASGEFTIPMQLGARPSPLDQMSMESWMNRQGFTSPYLRWYIDYSCRDDYGALARDTSAWAGIHYFAAREHEEKGPLTWPEGNGWVLKRLLSKLNHYVRTGQMVYRIQRSGKKLRVLTPETEYLADKVIFAAPTFLASHVIEDAPAWGMQYSPWLTANLTLDRLPPERGLDLAWDNVIYDSQSLGYVNATHMSLASHRDKTVWTYYWALAHQPPAEARRNLLDHDWNYWKEAILNDLARAHPDIRECVSNIDIMRIGHAMARPTPGVFSSPDRLHLSRPSGNLLYANSDLSGFSIFEEAQFRGVTAADAAVKFL